MTTNKQDRKQRPMALGVLDYFPDALAEIANVSYVGNQQHNPGQPLHWAKHKSTDHADCILRHMVDRGTLDDDGMRHTAKVAWRALAMLQVELDADKAGMSPKTGPGPYADELASGLSDMDAACALAEPFVSDQDVAQADERGEVEPLYFRGYPIQHVPDLSAHRPLTADSIIAAHYPDDCLAGIGALMETLLGGGLLGLMTNGGRVYIGIDTSRADANAAYEMDIRTLTEAGCVPDVVEQIVGGTFYQNDADPAYVYIAGPMRGYKDYNFPAFDVAAKNFQSVGFNTISPADIDRHAGDSDGVKEHELPHQRIFARRDFFALFLCSSRKNGAIAMLDGWEKSTGAVAEFFLARWLGLRVYNAETGQRLDQRDVDWVAFAVSLVDFLNSNKGR